MSESTQILTFPTTTGLDLGGRRTHWHRFDEHGKSAGHGSVPTTQDALEVVGVFDGDAPRAPPRGCA